MTPPVVFLLQLSALVVLGGCLLFKHCQRSAILPQPTDTSDWKGKGLDVSPLQPRIERVRHDYLAGRSPAAGSSSFRKGLLARARRELERLPFFWTKRQENLSEHSVKAG